MTETGYDYIIIGGGSAGCVLANRLSSNEDTSILLIESGRSHRNPLISIPIGYGLTANSPDYAYQFRSEPDTTTFNKRHPLPRGKALGGSSSVNGMVYIRGQHADYDQWAQEGATGWDWESVKPYFVEAVSQQRGVSEWHSTDGPLRIEDSRNYFPICEMLLQAGEHAGYPRNQDFNGESQEGIGYYQFTMKEGRRWSSANAYLDPAKSRPNLTIRTRERVEYINFDGRRAIGVTTSSGEFQARKEILLAAGAYASPQLLQISGIGPKDVLNSIDVNPILVNEGVGRNLQDHAGPPMAWRLKDAKDSVNRELSPLGMIVSMWKYLVNRRGPLAMPAASVGLFAKSRPDLPRPDLQFHCLPLSGIDTDDGRQHMDSFPGFTMMPYLMHPRSRGEVRAASRDISASPIITTNYFDASSDLEAVVSGMKIANRLAETRPFAARIESRIRPLPEEISDEALATYARVHAHTGYHPVGTCRMGIDDTAVVDNSCSVHGIEKLRVIDASIMPSLISGNTHATTVMIAEKISAEMLNQAG